MSSKVNMQNQPKDPEFLKILKARQGMRLISLDFSSIEDVVLAEHSKDENMIKLYAPGYPVNCGYLFLGSQLDVFKGKIRQYYDPNAPTRTEEQLTLAKKKCKPERQTCKGLRLALNYKAWPPKLQQIMQLHKYECSSVQAQQIFDGYWSTFPGIRDFDDKLYTEWYNNGGYIINGRGRPIAVGPHKKKDLVNMYCQSSSHDLLLTYISIVDRLVTERHIPMWPWIPDYHDESDWEVAESAVEEGKACMDDGLKRLNELIQPDIPIRGRAVDAADLAEVKCD